MIQGLLSFRVDARNSGSLQQQSFWEVQDSTADDLDP